ncbi:hypothetical protein GGI25_002276 [Coemansia spiralis]|uniref:H/ACA ribonucleoprotein complex subunit n=2 Tax=Coemansia TaxID=4863 RepID=A0A9W8GAD5_9FUNG|nr:Gar1/Naf1 RNA binding region-domain-containing protein [Coemansia spiralis]KAJ1995262.1 hypothetical protein EDC05_001100 [Coemansia umbellata]KAJ2625662.1 hypothetical protein GGI26_000462 [Coemansia sp. RSA 1358]KAJ2678482.1 hypothetical protein GGI25_002276 [Coemansia spiralis]
MSEPLANTTTEVSGQTVQEKSGDTGIDKLVETIKAANAYLADSSDSNSDSELDSMTSGSDIEIENIESDMETEAPATRNEIVDPEITRPAVAQVPIEELQLLGTIHTRVDASVLIRSAVSGEASVLDTGSLVCFGDGTTMGLVFDVFGPITRPWYAVRFASASEIDERCQKATEVFFAPVWATVVSTQGLRALRGTDASNEYDEEAGSDHMEFSDDEAERLFKKSKKTRAQKPPAKAAVEPAPPSVAGRSLQSYQDLYDPDLGF